MACWVKDPFSRPSMAQVLDILNGADFVPAPPKQFGQPTTPTSPPDGPIKQLQSVRRGRTAMLLRAPASLPEADENKPLSSAASFDSDFREVALFRAYWSRVSGGPCRVPATFFS